MIEIIIGVVIGIGVAFACMAFFVRGMRIGMTVSKGEKPATFTAPKKPIEEEESEYDKKADMYLNYDPFNPPKEDEE